MNSWWKGGNNNPSIMHDAFAGNNFSPAIENVPALATRVGNVINNVNPDVVTIQEGGGLYDMQDFFNRFVNGDWSVLRGSGGGQALITAAKMDTVNSFEIGDEVVGNIDLHSTFNADLNADYVIDEVSFARRPQVCNVEFGGSKFIIINNHLKSKYVQNARGLYNAGGAERILFYEGALKARRRISGEAFRIRQFLDELLDRNPDELIILAGDLNDGEGADFFERNFLTHSVVDRIFGSIFKAETQLKHVLFHGDSDDYTAQFYDFIDEENKDLVLDHIGLSPAIVRNWNWLGRVAVQEFEDQVDLNANTGREKYPSDHRPVVVQLDALVQ